MVENREEKSDVFRGVGRIVTIASDDDFLKIKETLTRVGIVTDNTRLVQVCYILHKKGKYAIVHLKELLSLDGINVEIDAIDISRRDTITNLLQQWKLLTISDTLNDSNISMHGLKVVPHRERASWTFSSQYNIGRK